MKALKALITVICLFSALAVNSQIQKNQITYGDFAPAANDQKLIKDGYKDLVKENKRFRKMKLSNRASYLSDDGKFLFEQPGNGDSRDFVSVDPSLDSNESLVMGGHSGIFLDPTMKDHWIVTIVSTGEQFIVGCLNKVKYKKNYSFGPPASSGAIVAEEFEDLNPTPADTFLGVSGIDFGNTTNTGNNSELDNIDLTGYTSIDAKRITANTTRVYTEPVTWRPITNKLFGWEKRMTPIESILVDALTAGIITGLTCITGDLVTDGNIDWNWTRENDTRSNSDGPIILPNDSGDE
jgi:hypothetical protein